MFTMKAFAVFLFLVTVSAHPLVIDVSSREPSPSPVPAPAAAPRQVPGSQAPLNSAQLNSTTGLHTLQDLYQGNQNFRQGARLQAAKVLDEAPSFMFLGCVDNRLSPSTIFNAPAGSIITHNNIANQYSSKDPSADAAVAYAIESLHVQHIIVLGHYGCKGVETAIAKSDKSSRLVRNWVKPISDLYSSSRRQEIVVLRDARKPRRGQDQGVKTAPPASDPGFRALVEENVKRGVKELRKHSILTKAYARGVRTDKNEIVDVFVHGFVYDEATGDVHDLNVSFGPPGKPIPNVPFQALKAAKNFHRDASSGSITSGKVWDFGSGK
ncbi:hypothetical protein GALMADRAFT_249264 [Galerina marginata CBS 339.88]|uniref:Carbonic anhydrase n=1 Tax=Galerina marginata (strain CBS 339.88) TaxID=685588 RepID=A0A067T8D7_GALM3|nr:hypothetical protein GALMADRAFT_249264 [Galerina marginata CBS 339.88]